MECPNGAQRGFYLRENRVRRQILLYKGDLNFVGVALECWRGWASETGG